jgi:hypothetical protein
LWHTNGKTNLLLFVDAYVRRNAEPKRLRCRRDGGKSAMVASVRSEQKHRSNDTRFW